MNESFFKKFDHYLQDPDLDTFLSLREAMAHSFTYSPNDTDQIIDEVSQLIEKGEYEQVRHMIAANLRMMFMNPSAHGFLAVALEKLGLKREAKEAFHIAETLLHTMILTGDGSRHAPYLVLCKSDQFDILKRLEKNPHRSTVVSDGERYCSIYESGDGSEIWFDITVPYTATNPQYKEPEHAKDAEATSTVRDIEFQPDYDPGLNRLSEKELAAYEPLYDKAWNLIEDDLYIAEDDNYQSPRLLTKRRLKKAAGYFREALKIHPRSFPSMWALGKIYQRLGMQEDSYEWFEKAYRVNPENPDILREAYYSALMTDRYALAEEFGTKAMESEPEEPAHASNLAIVLLINGKVLEAEACATEGYKRDMTSQEAASILSLVKDVAEGKRPSPRSLNDI